MLYQTTCVGLGYGPARPSLEAFLDSLGTPRFAPTGSPSDLRLRDRRICLPAALRPWPGTTTARDGLPSCVTPSLTAPRSGHRPRHPLGPKAAEAGAGLVSRGLALAVHTGYGNINPLTIDYACRPRLRTRLTLGGTTWPRNPWSTGAADSHRGYRYSCLHSHSPPLHQSLTGRLHRRWRRSPTQHPTHPTAARRTDHIRVLARLRRYA
jgi:hypothetical protein